MHPGGEGFPLAANATTIPLSDLTERLAALG